MPSTTWIFRCLRASWPGTFLLAAAAVAQPPAEPTVTSQAIAPDLHVLLGAGGGQVAGNVLASIGAQGVLIVDSGFPVFVPKYRAAIAQLGGGEIRFVLNTHWHDDHAEGNKVLGLGPAVLIAHANSREMLTRHNKVNVVRTVLDQPAYPPAALPAITFADRTEVFFNDEEIVLLHFARAHTAGDAAVIFRGHNTVHMGDVFLSAAYPFFDVDNGGDFDGLIEFCSRVLQEIDRDTIVVPGHGRVATYADLVSYVDMLRAVRGRIAALIADGATLAQVVAAQPTREWDAQYGNPTTYFIDRAYKSLMQVSE
jgi:glyoxylase-like metal-dependent hydrolase (beta-lactamase superfamily II)